VIVFATALAVLAYVDRVAISQASGPISERLGLSKSRMGLIFGAFALSYSLLEIPSGWLGDAIGPRKVLIRIVLAWSAFTALTGAAWNFVSLLVIRFLFGAGEAGCFPNLTKAFSTWLPRSEHAGAQGIMWAFARWGGAFTPPLVIFAFRHMSWRAAFVAFGSAGLVWCAAFRYWYRDHPSANRSIAPSRAVPITAIIPWRKVFTNRSVWLLCAQYFCVCFGWYFYITWLPAYLQEFRHQTPDAAAKLAIFPLLFGGFGSLLSGIIARPISKLFGRASRGLRGIAITGMLGAAACICAVTRIADPLHAMIAMGLASFANDLVMPPAWNACMDIGGRISGTVSSVMNTLGNLAGFVAPVFGGFLLDRTHGNWNLLLLVMAGVYVAGAMCWPFIDPLTPIEAS
jgi:ACS family glucarate transporter-like MFS transporter